MSLEVQLGLESYFRAIMRTRALAITDNPTMTSKAAQKENQAVRVVELFR